jgi:DNA-binding FadR family transcriptional regulator
VNLFGDLDSDRERDHHTEHRQIVDAVLGRDAEKVRVLFDDYYATAAPIRKSIVETLKQHEHGGRTRSEEEGE